MENNENENLNLTLDEINKIYEETVEFPEGTLIAGTNLSSFKWCYNDGPC